jgi:carbon storage regulator
VTRKEAMLVLTRRIGEQVVIAGNICVNIVAVQGDRVRLGIEAPDSVRVDRREVHERRDFRDAATPLADYPLDPTRQA